MMKLKKTNPLSMTAVILLISLNAFAQTLDLTSPLENSQSKFVPKYYSGVALVKFASKKFDDATKDDQRFIVGKAVTLGRLLSIAIFDKRTTHEIELTNFRISDGQVYLVRRPIALNDYENSAEELFNYSMVNDSKDEQIGQCSANVCRAIIVDQNLLTRITFIFNPRSITAYVNGLNYHGNARGISKFGDLKIVFKK